MESPNYTNKPATISVEHQFPLVQMEWSVVVDSWVSVEVHQKKWNARFEEVCNFLWFCRFKPCVLFISGCSEIFKKYIWPRSHNPWLLFGLITMATGLGLIVNGSLLSQNEYFSHLELCACNSFTLHTKGDGTLSLQEVGKWPVVTTQRCGCIED